MKNPGETKIRSGFARIVFVIITVLPVILFGWAEVNLVECYSTISW